MRSANAALPPTNGAGTTGIARPLNVRSFARVAARKIPTDPGCLRLTPPAAPLTMPLAFVLPNRRQERRAGATGRNPLTERS